MVVIPMKEATFLLTVYGIVGRIEVENQALGWPTKRRDKLLDQHLVQPPGRCPVGPVLPAAQGRGAGQCRVALDGRLQGQIIPQGLVVIEILIPQSQAI